MVQLEQSCRDKSDDEVELIAEKISDVQRAILTTEPTSEPFMLVSTSSNCLLTSSVVASAASSRNRAASRRSAFRDGLGVRSLMSVGGTLARGVPLEKPRPDRAERGLSLTTGKEKPHQSGASLKRGDPV